MAPTIEHLLEQTTEICVLGTLVGNEHTAQFLQEFSLDFIFSIFQSDTHKTEDIETITRAVSYLLSTPLGTSLVEELVPYGVTAMDSSFLSVKKLAIEQLSRVLETTSDQECYFTSLEVLFTAFRDRQTEIGISASNALLTHFKNFSKLEQLMESHRGLIQSLITDGDSIVQSRTLELLLNLSSSSSEICSLLESTGLLELERSQLLSFEDPLSCLAIWNVLVEFVSGLETESKAAVIVLDTLYPAIDNLITSFSELDAFLKPALMPCVATVIGLTYCAQNEHHNALLSRFLLLLKDGLNSSEAEWIESVLDALSLLGKTGSCSRAVMLIDGGLLETVVSSALSVGSPPTHRGIALHALANFCRNSPPIGPNFDPEVERRLKSVILEIGRDDEFWDFLHVRLKGPVMDFQPAVYNLMEALSSRLWFVCGVCANTVLLDYVTNPLSESERELCVARFETVKHMTRSVEGWLEDNTINQNQRELLELSIPRLRRSVDAGPYGAGRTTTESVPIIATERR